MTATLPRPLVSSVATTTDFTTTVSQIRMRIGDTGGENGLGRVFLSDERILNIYERFPTILSASIEAVRHILAEIARDVDRNAGGLNAQTSQAWEHYKQLLEILEGQSTTASITAVTVRLGGVTAARRITLLGNLDYNASRFEIDADRYTRPLGAASDVPP